MNKGQRMMHNIDRRKLEIFVGGGTFGFGAFILQPGNQMATKAYEALVSAMPEWQWGLSFAAIGAAHIMAVLVNGRRWWTPIARAWLCATTAMLYASFSVGFWLISPDTTAVYIYLLHASAAMWCFYYAVHDAARAWGARNVSA